MIISLEKFLILRSSKYFAIRTMSTSSNAPTLQKRRWTTKEKRCPDKRNSKRQINDDQNSSNPLLHCAEKVSSTNCVLIKRSSTDGTEPEDGCRVITTSQFEDALELSLEPKSSWVIVKPLVILDLNGILCHRVRKERVDTNPHLPYRPSIARIASTPVIPRDDIIPFLEALNRHYMIAVWTSAKRETAKVLIDSLFPIPLRDRLLFVWTQSECERVYTNESHKRKFEREIFRKPLLKVWKAYPLWNSSNTLLMDDSPDKCPDIQNTLHPPSLHGKICEGLSEHMPMSDEDNCILQRSFFTNLALQHFINPRETFPSTKVPTLELSKALSQLAKLHMGWRGVDLSDQVRISQHDNMCCP
jgi:NLI interacting factor-like phosphatase